MPSETRARACVSLARSDHQPVLRTSPKYLRIACQEPSDGGLMVAGSGGSSRALTHPAATRLMFSRPSRKSSLPSEQIPHQLIIQSDMMFVEDASALSCTCSAGWRAGASCLDAVVKHWSVAGLNLDGTSWQHTSPTSAIDT